MEKLAEQAMYDGALGLSSGLFYTPGNYSTTEEVIALARIVGQLGGIYISHIRDEAADLTVRLSKATSAMCREDDVGDGAHSMISGQWRGARKDSSLAMASLPGVRSLTRSVPTGATLADAARACQDPAITRWSLFGASSASGSTRTSGPRALMARCVRHQPGPARGRRGSRGRVRRTSGRSRPARR